MSARTGAAAAPTTATGPRRTTRTVKSDGSVVLNSNDGTGPRTVLRSSAALPACGEDNCCSARVRRIASMNLFPETVTVADKDVISRGVSKTRLFLLIMPLFALSITIKTILAPVAKITTVQYPTYGTFQEEVAPNPFTCTCSDPKVKVGSFAQLNVPAYLDATQNICASMANATAACSTPENYLGCSTTTAAAMAFSMFIFPCTNTCGSISLAQQVFVKNVLGSEPGLLLLDSGSFAEFVNRTVVAEAQKYQLLVAATKLSFETPILAYPVSYVNVSEGSRFNDPPGCTCDGQLLSPRDIVRGKECKFALPFDNSAQPAAFATCNQLRNLYTCPLRIFHNASFYTSVLGLPQEYASLANFSYNPRYSINDLTIVSALVTNTDALFASTGDGTQDLTQPANGLITADYQSYFSECAPSVCTYSTNSAPPFFTAVSTALGVLSGSIALMRMVLDTGVNVICRVRRANVVVESADGGDDNDDAGQEKGRDMQMPLLAMAATGASGPGPSFA